MSSDLISVASSDANKDQKVEKAKDDKQKKEDVDMKAKERRQDATTAPSKLCPIQNTAVTEVAKVPKVIEEAIANADEEASDVVDPHAAARIKNAK
jgi:hypothetical protein